MGHTPKPDNKKRTPEHISLKLRQTGVLSVQFKETESFKVDNKASNKERGFLRLKKILHFKGRNTQRDNI